MNANALGLQNCSSRRLTRNLFLVLPFIISISLLAACATATESVSPSPTPSATPQPSATFTVTPSATPVTPTPIPPPRLSVEGNRLVDEDGNTVVLHGVAIMDPLTLRSGCCPQWGGFGEDTLRVPGEWGATLVRVPIHPPMFYDTGAERSLLIMDQAIEWAAKHGMYVIIDYHGLGFPPDDFDRYDWAASTEEELFEFWDVVSEHYAGNNTVAFYQIYNEPSRDNSRGLVLEDWLRWKEFAEEAIAIIRENDPETIVIISGMKGGNDLSFALQAPIEGSNIAYAAHPYPGLYRWLPWDKAFGRVAEVYPVLLTEFGFDNGAGTDDFLREESFTGPGVYRDEIIRYADKLGLSWTAWVLSHDWTPRLLLDRQYNPSEYGEFIIEQLQRYAAEQDP